MLQRTNKALRLLKGMQCKLRLEISKRPSTKVQIPTGLTQSFRLPKYINLIPCSFTVKGILKSRGSPPHCAEAEGSLSYEIFCCFLPFSSLENWLAGSMSGPAIRWLLVDTKYIALRAWHQVIEIQMTYSNLQLVQYSSKYWLHKKPQTTC